MKMGGLGCCEMVTVVVARGQVAGSCRWRPRAVWQKLAQPNALSAVDFLHKTTPNFSRLFSFSQEKAVLHRWKGCTELLHRQPSEHVFVHDSIQRLH
jgi:hypothetical protein